MHEWADTVRPHLPVRSELFARVTGPVSMTGFVSMGPDGFQPCVRGPGNETHEQKEKPSQTGRQADRQTGRQTDRQANRQTGRQTGRQANRQAGRQASRQASRQAGRQAGRQANRQAGRQTGRQTDRQTGRQAGTHLRVPHTRETWPSPSSQQLMGGSFLPQDKTQTPRCGKPSSVSCFCLREPRAETQAQH